MYTYILILIISTSNGVTQQSYEFADKASCDSSSKHIVDKMNDYYGKILKPSVFAFCEPHSLTKY